jgi:nucleoside-diphosphate-sugar epimerase
MTGAGAGLTLVTGASGFVGGHLVEALVASGQRVRCLVRPKSDRRWLDGVGVTYAVGAVDDVAAMRHALDGVDVVFHLAGLTTAPRESDYDRVNHGGVVRLVDAMSARPARLVFCSSLAAGGPARAGRPLTEADPPAPIGPYGESKARAEQVVLAAGMPAVVVRPPAVYGPRERDILSAFRLASYGLAIRTGPPRQQLAMVHVSDLVRGLVAAGQSVTASGVYYVSGANHRWEEIVAAMSLAVGRPSRIIPLPAPMLRAAARGARAWARLSGTKALLTPERAQDLLQPAWICDDTRARQDLGYVPRVSLVDGMRTTAEWYRAAGWL